MSSPVFADELRDCAAALAPARRLGSRGRAARRRGSPALEAVDVVQPALFAVMVSLARLWRSFGVEPAAVVGHSQGEIAAAHVAGGALAGGRRPGRRRTQPGPGDDRGQGRHAGAGALARGVARRARGLGERVTLAAVNGPASVVASGDPDALDELERACEADGVRAAADSR